MMKDLLKSFLYIESSFLHILLLLYTDVDFYSVLLDRYFSCYVLRSKDCFSFIIADYYFFHIHSIRRFRFDTTTICNTSTIPTITCSSKAKSVLQMVWLTTISRNYNEEEDETKKKKINDALLLDSYPFFLLSFINYHQKNFHSLFAREFHHFDFVGCGY